MEIENRQLRGYEIEGHIGAGGFGAVYRAYQTAIDRDVAIKVILPRYANQPEFIRRFEVEAQFIAHLEHPHVVPLYDYWRDANGAYLVMRYLRGGSLRRHIEQGPLSPEAVARYIDQIASALAAAHQRNIIHRDIKPDNMLMDEDENIYLADFGIAKQMSQTRDAASAVEEEYITGSPAYIAPEQIMGVGLTPQTDLYALGVVLYEMLTGKSPFAVEAPAQYLAKHLYEPVPNPSEARPGLSLQVDMVVQRATAKRPEDRYESALLLASDLRKALLTETDHTPTAELKVVITSDELLSTQLPLQVFRNPYKGLQAFQEADEGDFFGRAALVNDLITRLAEPGAYNRLLVVVGPSGSGKSSIVRAGVIPALRTGKLPGSPHPFVTDMIPGSDPVAQLAAALERVATIPAAEIQLELAKGAGGLASVAARLLPADGMTELILVIDQFEEVFTLVRDEAERQQFIDLLIAAVTGTESRVRIILTLRADFYDQPLLYPSLADWVRHRTAVIVPMTVHEMEQAITVPAARVGAMFEPGLVTRIVGDIGEQPGVLPLLQYALTELFKRSDGRMMTLDAYHESGGVLGALGQRAGELYAELSDAEQAAAQQMFLRLITLGEGTEDTRRRVLITELLALDSRDRMQRLVDRFAEARLLTLDQDALTYTPTVEIAHEALTREWGLLRDWLDASRDDIRLQRRLAAGTQHWLDSNRDPGFLLSRTPLEQFESWAALTQISLTSHEREFLDASLAERERQHQAELERRAREAETARRAKNFGRASVALAITSAVALVMIVAALLSLSTAQTQAAAAEERVDAAELTLVAVDQALDERQRLRESVRLAAAANNTDDLDLTLLLGVRALETSYSPEADHAVLQALQRYEVMRQENNLPPPISEIPIRILHGHTDQIYTLQFSPDGTMLVSAGNDRIIRIWDLRTGQILRLLEGHTDSVTSVAFSPDGRTVLSSGDSTIRFWDVESGREIKRFEGHEGLVFGVVYTPDLRYVVSGGEDKTVRVWDVETGEQVHVLTGHTDMVYGAHLSHDGREIRSSGQDGTLRIWDFETGELLQTVQFTSPVYSATYSPDESIIVVVREDGTARLVDSQTFGERFTYRGHLFSVYSASFSPDGQYLVTSSRDMSARLWNPSTGEQLRVFEGHSADVAYAVFSADGRYIATAGWDNTLRIWDTDYRQTVAFACDNIARPLTAEERAAYLIPADATICGSELPILPTPQAVLPVWTPIPTATPIIPPQLVESDYLYVPVGHEITLDGNLDDWAGIDWITVTKPIVDSPNPDHSGSFRFAVSASEERLNVAMTVMDDNIVAGRHGTDYWNEDSFQFYLNASGNLATSTNIPGVSEFLINATNLDRPLADPYSVVAYDSSLFQPQVMTFRTADGWGFEATIAFLNDFRPAPGISIGFQAQMSGASDHDRDIKLGWSSLDTSDNAWHNPSLFGRIVFTEPP